MTETDQDAAELSSRIQTLLEQFDQASGRHQRDESFVAVDAVGYELLIKLQSPFGNGQTAERVASTNELQQRINHWLAVQRDLGRLGSVRIVITPSLDADLD